MKTITTRIREHLFNPTERLPDLQTIKRTQWDQKFADRMMRRMIMGAFRYGMVGSKKSLEIDYLASLRRKLEAYENDGNIEHLVDAANYVMLEYRFGKHPDKHFRSIDDGVHAESRRQ